MAWEPSASIDMLHIRARLMQDIREFFTQRGYLEVETPVLSHYGVTDVYLSNIQAQFQNRPYALQTSPEYHMKRLLAAGSGPIFQLARVFRDDELGRWHNPEFTLLEWYQLNQDHLALLEEVDALLQRFLKCGPLQKKTYREVFQKYCHIDPWETDVQALKNCVNHFDLGQVLDPEEADHDLYLFLLMSHIIEPQLAESVTPTAILDFPPSQASLACMTNGAAARFEIYYRGIELANGFHELTDPLLQKKRFEKDNLKRLEQGKKPVEIDNFLLAALEHGLPACSGVALGVDRLLALTTHQGNLSSCLSFEFSRA